MADCGARIDLSSTGHPAPTLRFENGAIIRAWGSELGRVFGRNTIDGVAPNTERCAIVRAWSSELGRVCGRNSIDGVAADPEDAPVADCRARVDLSSTGHTATTLRAEGCASVRAWSTEFGRVYGRNTIDGVAADP